MAIHGFRYSSYYLLKSNKFTEIYSSKMFIVDFIRLGFFESFIYLNSDIGKFNINWSQRHFKTVQANFDLQSIRGFFFEGV